MAAIRAGRKLSAIGFLAIASLLLSGDGSAADEVTFKGTRYLIFKAKPSEVQLVWANENGVPYQQFAVVQRVLEQRGERAHFLMNAGIFEPGNIPSGLTIVEGKTVVPLNKADGFGNFYLKPNGIFLISGERALIVPTENFPQNIPIRVATQSGPLLLDKGKIHPKFNASSASRLHRNGVGITKDGMVLFAMSEFGQERYPNLHEFAEFFREQGCESALFLDGDLSHMEIEPQIPSTVSNRFGAIFVVSEPKASRPAGESVEKPLRGSFITPGETP